MTIIRNVAAWFSTEEAAQWMRAQFGEGEFLLTRVDPHGVQITVTSHDDDKPHSFGVTSEGLVPLGRYLLAVAAAQGQDINKGFRGIQA